MIRKPLRRGAIGTLPIAPKAPAKARVRTVQGEPPTTEVVKRSVSAGRTAIVPKKPGTTFGFVTLRLHEVECIRTTREVDRDEIVLAAIKVEGEVKSTKGKAQVNGRARKGEQLTVGKFKKGDRRHFKSPKVLATFASGGGHAEWPRYYVTMLLMIEKDEGAIGAVVNGAIKSVDEELTAATSTAVATGATSLLSVMPGGGAIGSAVPLVGKAIGKAAGTAVGLALGEIRKSRADDVFETEHLKLTLDRFPAKAGEIPGSRETRTFKGAKGVYRATVSWAVS